MKYVPYIDECCAALEQSNEFLTDACLIKLVRAQNMLRKIEQSLPNNELEPLWSPMTPVGMVVKALETELETLFSLDMTTNSKSQFNSSFLHPLLIYVSDIPTTLPLYSSILVQNWAM